MKKILDKNFAYLIYFIVTILLFRDFIFSDDLLYGSDTIASGIFFRKMYADFVRQFWEIPMWDNFISSGIPFVDATHGDTFYPTSILKFFIPLHRALGWKLVIHIFLAGVFMFNFLKSFKLHKYASFLGGLAYMLAPMIVSLVHPGHDAKIYVAALLPLAFTFLYKALNMGRIKDYIFLGGVVGLMILTSHVQASYFALWLIFFYGLFIWISNYLASRNIKVVAKSFALFWFAMVIGLLIGAVQLIPPYLYSKEFSIRGTASKTTFEHAISWGLHPEEAFSLVVPEFCGDGSSNMPYIKQIRNQFGNNEAKIKEIYNQYIASKRQRAGDTYWGRNVFKLNTEYSGIVMLVLTLAALLLGVVHRFKEVVFFGSMSLVFLLYALVNHTPLFYLFYKIVPGVNLFRGQSMIMFLFTFCITIAGTLLLDQIFKSGKSNILKVIQSGKGKIYLGIILLLLFIPILFPAIYLAVFKSPAFPDDFYVSIIKQGAVINIVLIVIIFASLILFLKSKINRIQLVVILALIISFDTIRIDKNYIKTISKKQLATKFYADAQVKQINREREKEGYFRVYNIDQYPTNELGIHHVETVDGFHDNELKWYRKYRGTNKHGVNNDSNLKYGLQNNSDTPFLNIAGVKYIMYKDNKGVSYTLPNPNYLKRAFVVSGYEVIKDEDKIVERIKDKSFDYRNKVILEEEPDLKVNLIHSDSLNSGKVIDYVYQGNEIKCIVEMNRAGILFISDNYFPYWSAYNQNGEKIKIYKANLTYRALFLDKGKHNLTFKYRSVPYLWGKYLSIFGIVIIFITIVLSWLRKDKTSKK